MIDRTDVERAADRIAGRVRRTPVLEVEDRRFGWPTFLKLELLQHTGSFKPRGIFNRMLAASVPEVGVIAASGGNAGLAVAHAARELGHRAEIFVPESSPRLKVERLRTLGAEVTVTGAFYAEALDASAERAAETGALVVHAYDQPEVVAGQGTLACELAEQIPGLDTVLVAAGGGGLVAGIAAALEGRRCGVVAVEPVDVAVGGVAADSLGARRVGRICFAVATRTGIRSTLVPDEAIVSAQRMLWAEFRVVAEPGGAAALAALLCGAYKPHPDERVGVVVCGANTDPATVTGLSGSAK
ncbi:MAG: pyridoxal-phosphate dependent enzyme [Streptosporangiales bacterium]|nr:pyridoxal-phosphate dependent enzyme [Streptosporangiales bacterium]